MGWKGETAKGSRRKLSLGLDLRFDLGLGLRLGFGLGFRRSGRFPGGASTLEEHEQQSQDAS